MCKSCSRTLVKLTDLLCYSSSAEITILFVKLKQRFYFLCQRFSSAFVYLSENGVGKTKKEKEGTLTDENGKRINLSNEKKNKDEFPER